MNSIFPQAIAFVNPKASDVPQLVALRHRLGRKVAETIQTISRKTFEARAKYQTDNKWLDTGVWYPAEYLAALIKTNQQKRFEYLKKNECAIRGYVNGKYFDRGSNNFEFIAKKGVKPSQAMSKITKRFALLDCGTVAQTARYFALLDVLGEEKFNRLFGGEDSERINLCYKDHKLQPMRYFVNFTQAATISPEPFLEAARKANETGQVLYFSDVTHESIGTEGKRPVKVGQVVSFNGPDRTPYFLKHPFGMASNFNATCNNEIPGEQRFCAHGIPPEGYSEEQFNAYLAERYNDDDTQREELRADPQNPHHQAAIQRSRALNGHKVTPAQVMGYDPGSPQDFNLRLIQDLIDLKLEEVTMEFVRNHPEAKQSIAALENADLLLKTATLAMTEASSMAK